MRPGWVVAVALAAGCAVPPAGTPAVRLPRLRVSPEGRFLAREDGAPFFWQGDTAWAFFEKASLSPKPDQPAVEAYFRDRAAKGFNVLQAALIFDRVPNAEGHEPFADGDFSRPRVTDGPGNDFWDTVDRLVGLAEAHGIYLALLPVWLVNLPDDHPMVKDPSVPYRYGHFLGTRYGRRTPIIWILGGDPYRKGTDMDNPARLALTRALAEGIADGNNGVDRQDGRADYSTTLMSFHPPGGGKSSSRSLHDEPWLDFNMIQSTTRRNFENYRTVAADYERRPVKPTFESEVAYEYSLSLAVPRETPEPRIAPWDVRRAAYWGVLAGGFGHTYGHRSFIRWTRRGEKLKYGADVPWFEALDAPGARQMAHLRNLMLSRPFFSRVPDQELIAGDPGSGSDHARATRCQDGSFAFVYLPSGKPVTVRLGRIAGGGVKAWWYDPRDGSAVAAGEFTASGDRTFAPPSSGEGCDWVLVLDHAARGFQAPGRREDVERALIPHTDVRFNLVHLAGGRFRMGSPEDESGRDSDEGPSREVELKPFRIGAREVTWGEFNLFLHGPVEEVDARASPSLLASLGIPREMWNSQWPVVGLRWHSAMGYCRWLSRRTRHLYRLPTEAEWEYACRAGSDGAAPDPLVDYAWFDLNGRNGSREGGGRKPNAFGLYDMLGNAWEYCLEPYAPPDFEPVLRGGSWRSPASELRAANRQSLREEWHEHDPNRPRSLWWFAGDFTQGFRIVRVADASDAGQREAYAAKVEVTFQGSEERTVKKDRSMEYFRRVRGEVMNAGDRSLDELHLVVYFLDPKGRPHMTDERLRPTFTYGFPVLVNSAHEGGHRRPLKAGETRKFTVDLPETFDGADEVQGDRFGARVAGLVFGGG